MIILFLASLDQLKTGKYINLSFSDYYVYDNLDIKDATLEEMSIGDLLKASVVHKVEDKDLTAYKTELLKDPLVILTQHLHTLKH